MLVAPWVEDCSVAAAMTRDDGGVRDGAAETPAARQVQAASKSVAIIAKVLTCMSGAPDERTLLRASVKAELRGARSPRAATRGFGASVTRRVILTVAADKEPVMRRSAIVLCARRR